MASNPVFREFDQDLAKGKYAGIGNNQPRYGQFGTPEQVTAAGGAAYAQQEQSLEQMYGAPAATSAQTGRMTLDDVVTKNLILFGILLVTAAAGWFAPVNLSFALLLGGMIGGLIVGLVISFKARKGNISVPLILAYAALEGLFVGAASRAFESMYSGVVVQAVLATLCVFGAMFAGWKFGVIKVTERSRKIFGFAIVGYLLFAVVNFLLVITGVLSNPFGVGGSGMLGIAISIFAVGLASYSLAIDFDTIERGVAAGLPEKYSWLMAHGLLVSVVWLYLEMLRLLSRLQSRN